MRVYFPLSHTLTHLHHCQTHRDEKQQRDRTRQEARGSKREGSKKRGYLRSTYTFCYSCFCWLPSLPAHYRMFLIIVSNSSSLRCRFFFAIFFRHFISISYAKAGSPTGCERARAWTANEWMRVRSRWHLTIRFWISKWRSEFCAAIRLSRRRLSNSGIPALFGRNTICASHLFIFFFFFCASCFNRYFSFYRNGIRGKRWAFTCKPKIQFAVNQPNHPCIVVTALSQ